MPDVQLIINIPEAHVDRVVDALSTHFGHIAGNKRVFVRNSIIRLLKRIVKSVEVDEARRVANSQPGPDIG